MYEANGRKEIREAVIIAIGVGIANKLIDKVFERVNCTHVVCQCADCKAKRAAEEAAKSGPADEPGKGQ